jgi:hypothetical protein
MNFKEQDEAVMKALKLEIVTDAGARQEVPLIFGDAEKLELISGGAGVSKEAVPAAALFRTGFSDNHFGGWSFNYVLLLNTKFHSDMDQLLEQLCLKLYAPLRVRVDDTEYALKLHSGCLDDGNTSSKNKTFRYSLNLTLNSGVL